MLNGDSVQAKSGRRLLLRRTLLLWLCESRVYMLPTIEWVSILVSREAHAGLAPTRASRRSPAEVSFPV